MNKTKYPVLQQLLQFLLFFVLFICYSSGLLIWPIRHATPMILLPLLIAFAMFEEELPAAIVGLVLGIFIDGSSAIGVVFHTVLFFAVGFTVSLLLHYYMNNNLRTAIVLTLLGSLLYFLLRWLLCLVFRDSMLGNTQYLMQYAIPSVLYTTVYIFPFYYLQRLMHRFKLK